MGSRITAATALAAALAVTTSAHAFEVKHAEGGELVRWKRAKVVWTVDRSVKEVPDGPAAVTAAMKAWTQREGAPKLAVGDPDGALEPGLDGTNAIFYVEGGFAPAGSALAITVLSFDDLTGEVLDADIILNGKYDLGRIRAGAHAPTSADDPGAETYDVRRILAHEMGHALGLSDELALKDALMYPYVARAQALSAAPGPDDLAGLQTLYSDTNGAPASGSVDEGRAGCSGAVVARSGPGSAPGGALCATGLLIAAVVLARSKRRDGRRAAGCTVLAAAALVMPPVLRGADTGASASDVDARAVVTAVRTTATKGIFRSEVEVVSTSCASARCPVVSRMVVWGGTLDGVKQVIGGTAVPTAGDRVVVTKVGE